MYTYPTGERDLFNEMIAYFYTLPDNAFSCPHLSKIFGKNGTIHQYLLAKKPVDKTKYAVINNEFDMFSMHHHRGTINEIIFSQSTFYRNKVTGRLQYLFKDPSDCFIFGFELPADNNVTIVLYWSLINKDRESDQALSACKQDTNVILNFNCLSEAHKVLLVYKLSQFK